MNKLLAAAGVGMVLVVGGCSTTLLVGAAGLGAATAATCTPTTPGAAPAEQPTPAVAQVDLAAPPASVGDYSREQLENAAAIMAAGQAEGLDAHGQSIGVMTAIGESTLRVLDSGDAAGPDSRGLFQQRANGAWGTYADRMDPTISATNFFRALQAIPGWQALSPTQAAHRVQRNADPNHYARFWNDAVQIVAALRDDPALAEQLGQMAGNQPCGALTAEAAPAVALNGWARPADAPLTSDFGLRVHPVSRVTKPHNGIDLGGECGDPMYAAAAGRVVESGPATGFGNWIVLEHAEGIRTVYGHMDAVDLLVDVGQSVTAGQLISKIGTAGTSTGCHLHFEIHTGTTAIDPVPFLQARGVTFA